MSNNDSSPQVLIIGAGISGLLIAQGLQKNKIPLRIFDREPSALYYRPREWGLSLQWGLSMLPSILPDDLLHRVRSDAANDPNFEPPDPGIMPTFDGRTGEKIKDVRLGYMVRVSRRRFRKLCAEGVRVEYGKTLTAITYNDADPDNNVPATATAHFADGTSATGTTLIGADGAHSTVRTLTVGAEGGRARAVPLCAVNLHVRYGDAEKARIVRSCHPIMAHAIHPDGYWMFIAIQDVPDPEAPETWTFQLQCTWKRREGEEEIRELMLEDLKRRIENAGEPFRSAFMWIPEGTPIFVNRISFWIPIPWDTHDGKVLLAGDAAHPMTFHRGQGMNHGIADASMITRELKAALVDGQKNVAEAVNEYMNEVVERAGDEVRVSIENTDMLHDWDRAMNSALLQRGGQATEKLKTRS